MGRSGGSRPLVHAGRRMSRWSLRRGSVFPQMHRSRMASFRLATVVLAFLLVTMVGVPGGVLAAPVAFSTPVIVATSVQMIATSDWVPASPDPSGVAYLPGSGRLVVVDSEVNEVDPLTGDPTTGAGYNGVNLWQYSVVGSTIDDTGTTFPAFSSEPTGLGHDPVTNTLFISDDDIHRIFVDKPGPDGRFGTTDDIVTFVDAGAYGSTDTEDPEFDPSSGHLFFLDGGGTEIYEIDPVNAKFGDGDDVMTHFDIGHLGPADWEGLARHPLRDTLLVGAVGEREIYEITKTGVLVQIIDLSGIAGLRSISGHGVGPASSGSQLRIWVVDRGIDNGEDPTENDGRLFEISVPGFNSTNLPPLVDAGIDRTVTVGGTVMLDGTVSDDGLPDPPGSVTATWSRVSGPPGGTVTFDDSNALDAVAGFSVAGVLRVGVVC